ncbi:hypothetical protein VaNZ11_006939 [Volvox africanus]|uniref:F-box domain-containing protein n=1 Tax=Volvox africanus TaxID=51714 RepID=A0ABQ5S2G3_9CHLO|nr:hypothetical protein VaNZ11_006939 [Volvox africanus]
MRENDFNVVPLTCFSGEGMCSCNPATPPPVRNDDLTDDALVQIFNIIAMEFGPSAHSSWPKAAGRLFAWFRRTIPLVCKRWNNLLGSKFTWSSVLISMEAEMPRRRKADVGGFATASHGVAGQQHCFGSSPTAAVPGSSPPTTCSYMLLARSSLTALPKLRSKAVMQWAEVRGHSIQHLMLDLGGSGSHDFDGSRALDTLLRAANRGLRGLRTLRLVWPEGAGGQDSYEVLGRLRGLAELDVNGLQQGFLGGTLPYLSGLTGLTRLSFTPKTFQFPVSVPTLPTNLVVLHLSNIWVRRLPPVASSAPRLSELRLVGCHLVDGLLGALEGATALEELRLDGSRLTDSREEAKAWENAGESFWPSCPGLRRLGLADCGLRALPAPVIRAFPALAHLDLSNNPSLGGAVGAPDAAALAAASACLPPDLSQLTGLRDVRLAKCGLTVVPAALLAITSLTSLDLHHNSLSALPLAPESPSTSPSGPSSCSTGPYTLQSSPRRLSSSVPLCGTQGTNGSVTPGVARSLPSRGAKPLGNGVGGAHPGVLGVGGAEGGAAANGAAGGTGYGGADGGRGGGGGGAGSFSLFSERLQVLNIAMNRFTMWPQGLLSCAQLRELVVGELLVARAAEGDIERYLGVLPRLQRFAVCGDSFEPSAVRNLMALQRAVADKRGLRVDVTGF